MIRAAEVKIKGVLARGLAMLSNLLRTRPTTTTCIVSYAHIFISPLSYPFTTIIPLEVLEFYYYYSYPLRLLITSNYELTFFYSSFNTKKSLTSRSALSDSLPMYDGNAGHTSCYRCVWDVGRFCC